MGRGKPHHIPAGGIVLIQNSRSLTANQPERYVGHSYNEILRHAAKWYVTTFSLTRAMRMGSGGQRREGLRAEELGADGVEDLAVFSGEAKPDERQRVDHHERAY